MYFNLMLLKIFFSIVTVYKIINPNLTPPHPIHNFVQNMICVILMAYTTLNFTGGHHGGANQHIEIIRRFQEFQEFYKYKYKYENGYEIKVAASAA